METILVKIFATALALSEVITEPQAVKTHFDPVVDHTFGTDTSSRQRSHLRLGIMRKGFTEPPLTRQAT